MHPGMAIACSIPGWRSFRPRMAIDASQDCDHPSRVGYHYNPGWRSMHPGMVIYASGGGDRYTTGWRRSFPDGDRCIPGLRSMHPGMAIDAIRDGDHASQDGYHCSPGWRSRDGDRFTPLYLKLVLFGIIYQITLLMPILCLYLNHLLLTICTI